MKREFLGAALAVCALLLTGAASATDPVAAPEPTAAASETPTLAELGAAPLFSEPQLSPDGGRIAARGLVQGVPSLVLVDLTTPDHPAAALDVPHGEILDSYHWAGSGQLILGLIRGRDHRYLVRNLATGADVALKVDGDIIHIDRAGRFLLLSGGKGAAPAVYRVDLGTGAATRIVAPQDGVMSWHADGAGVVRAGRAWRRGRQMLFYRTGDDRTFAATPVATGDTPEIDQIAPIAGSDQGYAIAGSAKGRAGLYRYDFATNRLGALIYENPRVDLDGFQLDAAGKLTGVIYTADREETAWLDPAMQALAAQVDAALPGRRNRIAATGERRLLVWSATDGDVGAWYVFDRDTARADFLTRPRASLGGKRLATIRPVSFTARDGLAITGYLTLPNGRDPRGLPLIVMPHGGPFARDTMDYDSWVQFLASRGYAVLQPNYRGSTGFGRAFEARGDGQWGRAMQDDIDDGVKWLAAQGTIDPGRVCIMGASFGGYAAMWATIRNPDMYRCAISYAGVSDIAGQLAFDKPTFESRRSFRDWQGRIQGSASFPLASISPLQQAARIRVPLFIAHGSADSTVPVDQSRQMDAALTRLGLPHSYVEYGGENHSMEDPANEMDFLRRVGDFLDRYNPA